MNIKQIFTFAIIAMFLLVPFASAKQEVADSVKQNKKIDEKTIDKTKGSAKEISNKDKDIKGKVTVTDSDSSKYTVEKKSETEISISKQEAKGEHTKSKVTFAKEDLKSIDVDGDQLYGVLHIADDGSTSHDVYTESQLTSGTEMIFSENIVNGYSGYWEGTYTGVTSGTIINTPDVSGSDYYITASVNGTVPTYAAGIPSSGLVAYWNMNSIYNTVNVSSNPLSLKNGASLVNGALVLDGINDFADAGRIPAIEGVPELTVYTLVNSSNWTVPATLYPALMGVRVAGGEGPFSLRVEPTGSGNDKKISLQTRNSTNNMVTVVSNSAMPVNSRVAVIGTIDDNQVIFSIDGILQGSVGNWIGVTDASSSNTTLGVSRTAFSEYFRGNVYEAAIYSTGLNASLRKQLYAGGSGISLQPEPSYNFTGYNVASGAEKIIDTDATCTGIEYVDTTGGTHTVTVRIYFTEDITKTTETKGAVYQNVSIIHTKQNATASVGTITYELDPLYSGTPVLSSNNTNATVSRNDTHVLISTGLVKQGQSFSYVVSVADDHDHGIHLNQLMKWVGTGLDFVGVAPDNWDDYIGDQIEVTVS